jgi:thioredoxin 1
MPVIGITLQEDYEKMISEGVTLVDFNTRWCGPCRAQDPIISALEEAYPGKVKVLKIDVDTYPQIARKQGIQSIPTILIFSAGREIRRFIGLQSARSLEQALDGVLQRAEQ